jgi:hypothetical protein
VALCVQLIEMHLAALAVTDHVERLNRHSDKAQAQL